MSVTQIDEIMDINSKQYKFILNFIDGTRSKFVDDLDFKWNNDTIIDKCLCKIPEMKLSNYFNNKLHPEAISIQSEINQLIFKCNNYFITKSQFVKRVEVLYDKLKKLGLNSVFYDRYEDKRKFIKENKFLVIKGVGGIGKSHFIKQIYDSLKENVNVLACYGKSKISIDDIPWDKIYDLVIKNEFVFIFDAINEIPQNERYKLYKNLNRLKRFKNARIILTYRSYSITDCFYNGIREEKYLESKSSDINDFQGVDFYDAINKIVANYKIDISKIYNLIETNNPMIINMMIQADLLTNKSYLDKLKEKKMLHF